MKNRYIGSIIIWSMTGQSVIALIVLILLSCGTRDEKPLRGERVFDVKTQRVVYTVSSLKHRVGGYLEAVHSVSVKPEVSGRVLEIFAEEGDTVRKGEPLIRIEDETYRKAYEEVLWELRQAERDYENQKALLQRRKALYEKELISREEFEEVRTRVEVLRAKIESLRVRLERRKLDLDRTLLRSPMNGVVLKRSVSVGDYVTPQSEVYRILRTDPLRFVFKVPQEMVSYLKPGTPLEIEIAGERIKTKVSYVSPSADENRLFTVKALLPNRSGLLKPNTYGEVTFSFRNVRAVPVPEQAVQLSQRQSFLWVVRDSRAVKVPVQVLQHEGDRLLVVGDLKRDDRVVVEGLLFLYEGAKVRER